MEKIEECKPNENEKSQNSEHLDNTASESSVLYQTCLEEQPQQSGESQTDTSFIESSGFIEDSSQHTDEYYSGDSTYIEADQTAEVDSSSNSFMENDITQMKIQTNETFLKDISNKGFVNSDSEELEKSVVVSSQSDSAVSSASSLTWPADKTNDESMNSPNVKLSTTNDESLQETEPVSVKSESATSADVTGNLDNSDVIQQYSEVNSVDTLNEMEKSDELLYFPITSENVPRPENVEKSGTSEILECPQIIESASTTTDNKGEAENFVVDDAVENVSLEAVQTEDVKNPEDFQLENAHTEVSDSKETSTEQLVVNEDILISTNNEVDSSKEDANTKETGECVAHYGIIEGVGEHYFVQEDGTIQKISETDIREGTVYLAENETNIEQDNNTVFVIQEIDINEGQDGSKETVVISHDTSAGLTHENVIIEDLEESVDSPDEILIEKEDNTKDTDDEKMEVENKKFVKVPERLITEKGKPLKIPSHVLGRNIENPVNDVVANGRVAPPKPRLGVKIPYRNLTSQIVSKQEIENVIMERSRLRNATHDPPIGGDLFFAKKLTQRLAKKLAPNFSDEPEKDNKKKDVISEPSSSKNVNRIENNSDLLAILEGDDDEFSNTTTTKQVPDVYKISKEKEKLIALQQLQQLPRRKGKHIIESSNKIVATISKEIKQPIKPVKVETSAKSVEIVPNKTNIEKEKVDIVVSKEEPTIKSRFSTSIPVKTYTRKRKSSDEKITLTEEVKKIIKSEAKVDAALPPNTYVTKSSRIIKKKIIWDPDEVATSSRYSTKPLPIKQITIKSPEKKIEKPVEKKIENQVDKKLHKPVEKKSEKQVEKKSDKATENKQEKQTNKVEKQLVNNVEKTLEKKDEKLSEKKLEKSAEKKTETIVKEKSPEKKQETDKKLKETQKTVILKRPKRLTEVDKLLMDEGAVNMLYDVKNTDEQTQIKHSKRKQTVISLDKIQRELLNKTNEIKNDLQISTSKESTKSLRKKDSTLVVSPKTPKKESPGTVTRKQSRDSLRSSVHTPPASPTNAFTQPAEASRIIRRHSSSSFSSEDGEEMNDSQQSERVTRKRAAANSVVVSESPKTKKIKRFQGKENLSVQEKKKLNEEMSKNFNKLVTSSETIEPEFAKFKTVQVKRFDKLIQITLNPDKKESTLSVEVLNELFEVLNVLENDNCHAVVMNSSGKSFCQGIDYRTLVFDNEETRKKHATQLAISVRNFLKCLANFPKVIIVGVQGNIVGLGVTMLPLFDIVLASDAATFSTPYGQLGCAAEGALLLTLPHSANYSLAGELLFTNQTLLADEAAQRGLVTRTVWRETFEEELISVGINVSNSSRQSIECTKKHMRQHILPTIEAAIESETNVLIQHWTSEECQIKFSAYNFDNE